MIAVYRLATSCNSDWCGLATTRLDSGVDGRRERNIDFFLSLGYIIMGRLSPAVVDAGDVALLSIEVLRAAGPPRRTVHDRRIAM